MDLFGGKICALTFSILIFSEVCYRELIYLGRPVFPLLVEKIRVE